MKKTELFAEIAGLILVSAYAWWTTGLHPFTDVVYAAVAPPVAIVGGLRLCETFVRTDREATLDDLPLTSRFLGIALTAFVVLLAVGLEAAGLALGGRSVVVPTLSTVIDHALRWHGTRAAIFLAWLGIGVRPFFRVRRQFPTGQT